MDAEPEEVISAIATREQVSQVLSQGDVNIRLETGMERSAKEVLNELDTDISAFELIKGCLAG